MEFVNGNNVEYLNSPWFGPDSESREMGEGRTNPTLRRNSMLARRHSVHPYLQLMEAPNIRWFPGVKPPPVPERLSGRLSRLHHMALEGAINVLSALLPIVSEIPDRATLNKALSIIGAVVPKDAFRIFSKLGGSSKLIRLAYRRVPGEVLLFVMEDLMNNLPEDTMSLPENVRFIRPGMEDNFSPDDDTPA